MKAFLTLTTLIWGFSIALSQECQTPFNFNNWSKEGSPDGIWEVVDSANIINTSYIFPATFFVSQKKLINVLIRGTMSVESSIDNDFIGIVLGYKKPTQLADNNQYNFFLFDWKSKRESFNGYRAEEGFRLSYYNGFINMQEQDRYFWGAVENPPVRTLLNEKYGNSLGWVHHKKYEFTLLYTTSRLHITIDDEVILEQEGCFKAGKFGFYCMSQDLTRFENFTYQSYIDFVPFPETVCVGEKIRFNSFNLDCSEFPDFIESMNWDFGDGQSSTAINPEHTYSKADDCIDTIVKTVVIKPNPIVGLGNDTIVPACSSIILDAGNPGSDYSWSTSQISQTIELKELIQDTSIWVIVNKNGCLTADTISVSIEENIVKQQLFFPNAFTPNGDGNNDVLKAVGPTDNVSMYSLIIFNRWGQQIFETDDPNAGWDGSNPMQVGVYVYKVTYRIEGNCIETKNYSGSGTVALVK